MKIELKWLGHSAWWIQFGDYRLLIDPFLADNPSAQTKPDSLQPTHIFISHGHFDHILDAVEISKQSKATIITNFEIAGWLESKYGLSGNVGMNLGGKTTLPFGTVQYTPAVHSSVLPDGSAGGAAGGFLLTIRGTPESPRPYTIYYTGDTALFSDMRLIARNGVDCMIVPIGDLFTMGPDESIEAIQMVTPKVVLPTHYNTWPPIAQDAAAWCEDVRRKSAAKPIAPQVNEVVELDTSSE